MLYKVPQQQFWRPPQFNPLQSHVMSFSDSQALFSPSVVDIPALLQNKQHSTDTSISLVHMDADVSTTVMCSIRKLFLLLFKTMHTVYQKTSYIFDYRAI